MIDISIDVKRKFVDNKNLLSCFRLSLIRTAEKTENNNPIYRNLWTNELWERYEYDKVEALKISAFAYRVYPYPKTSELINIGINSNIEAEIKGASRLLYEMEFAGYEFRTELIEEMEHSADSLTATKFKTIYINANLDNKSNLREILNKSEKEISADFQHYKTLYQRAKSLKKNFK